MSLPFVELPMTPSPSSLKRQRLEDDDQAPPAKQHCKIEEQEVVAAAANNVGRTDTRQRVKDEDQAPPTKQQCKIEEQEATKMSQRDTRHLTPAVVKELYMHISQLRLVAVEGEGGDGNTTNVCKILNMYMDGDGRLVFVVQLDTVVRGVSPEVTEVFAETMIRCDDIIDRFYQYIIADCTNILRGTGRGQGTCRGNAGGRKVRPEDIGTPVPHDAHRSSLTKNSCMVDVVTMVHRAFDKPFDGTVVDIYTLRKLRDQIFAVRYIMRVHVPVMIQENIYDHKQQCNHCHIMPKGGVYVCIAMSSNDINHGFVVDTRGDIDILLDSSLPHAVEYTELAMSWVMYWQKVYRMGIRGKKNKSKKKKKKSSIVKIELE
jgi:hypothetical protein